MSDFNINDVVVSTSGETLVVADVLIDGWGVTRYRVCKYGCDTPLTLLYTNCDLKKKKQNFLTWCVDKIVGDK